MPESSLSIQLSTLATEVGHYLGFGRTTTNWTGWSATTPYVPVAAGSVAADDTQLAWIMHVIREGYRQFLYPELVDQGPTAYEWSFLTPDKQLVVSAGQTNYNLPDDFRDLMGELTYQPGDATYLTIVQCSIGEIDRALQMLQNVSDKPTRCAIIPLSSDGTQGQRWQIRFAPTPDATYTLNYRYAVIPQALSATNPFPYGGMAHGPTLLASCLAVAELQMRGEAGILGEKYVKRLQSSLALDRELRPQYWGYNADRSDSRDVLGGWGSMNPWATQTTGSTYNGVQY